MFRISRTWRKKATQQEENKLHQNEKKTSSTWLQHTIVVAWPHQTRNSCLIIVAFNLMWKKRARPQFMSARKLKPKEKRSPINMSTVELETAVAVEMAPVNKRYIWKKKIKEKMNVKNIIRKKRAKSILDGKKVFFVWIPLHFLIVFAVKKREKKLPFPHSIRLCSKRNGNNTKWFSNPSPFQTFSFYRWHNVSFSIFSRCFSPFVQTTFQRVHFAKLTFKNWINNS